MQQKFMGTNVCKKNGLFLFGQKGYALSKESCAKTFGGRIGLGLLSNNFRQFSCEDCKEPSGAKKKPTAARLTQASSVVCLLFRDCFAILGLLRSPPPDLRVFFAKLSCNTCSRNEVGLPTSITR
ncbi:MAG: hypothetical protein IJ664_03760, partial [Clostridia bacterium]|nr:hypothetical protein [Clostridia bacterium]